VEDVNVIYLRRLNGNRVIVTVVAAPLSETLCVAAETFSALSVNVSVSLWTPRVSGANSTLSVQLSPAVSDVLDMQSVSTP
jgi:nicotinamidase-related amidase